MVSEGDGMHDQGETLGVRIGAREIYDEVVGLREDVRSLGQQGESVDETLEDHETRIRSLEGERGKFVLPVALITAVATVVAAGLTVAKVAG
ncbi:hypothetical protein [Streptomyces spectabilis]|uniref:DUF3618 domain-containing protein n=2 Tax=Streptomyces spectabilis TaxID=68270 RepID=A0A7W8ETN1_STRST|nr:hypothetical protein [Streptomyces spectabilis]MBB5103333.1 hypothetical protein [Streptomyces spectabilis]MCI3902523.1 hypothetical protein [Streptomyces spectabilis]GGV54235.1 hypothetical protein GCM10010245_85700 [Streptomyces spectabilis]